MRALHFPWLELSILIAALGAVVVYFTSDRAQARRRSILYSGLTLVTSVGGWIDFGLLRTFEAHDSWDPIARLLGVEVLAVDELSAPLLPLVATLFFLTHLATLRTKLRDYSFAQSLASESIVLATLSCRTPWILIFLLAAGTIPPWMEFYRTRKPARVYVLHMAAFVLLLVLGQILLDRGQDSPFALTGILLLTLAVLLRNGIVPAHGWLPDLFEHLSFGTAMLFITPMLGAYGMTRLVLPMAPLWVLKAVSFASLFTALYAASMALVQREARRFFSYILLSNASLVLVGLETATPIGLVGALSLWLAVSLSLTGFGLTMRCVESRVGRTSLLDFHGLYQQVPMLAALFLITGLASVGFPGTAGFVGLELLVEGAVRSDPLVGVAVVVVAALNGLAILHAYFRIFTGKTHAGTIDIRVRRAERISVLILTSLIFSGGLYPQPGVQTRYHAAVELYKLRASHRPDQLYPGFSSMIPDDQGKAAAPPH